MNMQSVYSPENVFRVITPSPRTRIASQSRAGFPLITSAFTLIELLVVIAIIAILAAILFPVFASARLKARQTTCSSNLRQIGLGIRMYADDWDGVAPETTHTGGGSPDRCWIFQLKPYIARCDDIRICPSDPKGEARKAQNGTSYILNEYVVVPDPDPNNPDSYQPLPKLDSFGRPAETILAFTVSDEKGPSYTDDHTHSRTWFNRPTGAWLRVLADIEPDRHRVGSVPSNMTNLIDRRTKFDRTAGVANYLYLDGHIKSIPAGRIKAWADSGFNFALPPQ